jgi:protein-tyrosine phosphatase
MVEDEADFRSSAFAQRGPVITDALANFRDLGGLPTAEGRTTRTGVLYRSDAPRAGDRPPGLAPSWPPALVFDLRSTGESEGAHALIEGGSIVRRLPILDPAAGPPAATAERTRTEFSMARLYTSMAGRLGTRMAEVLTEAVETPGPVLVHCAAGKDRTGVLVAIMLRAAGVTREAVAADYDLTSQRTDQMRARLRAHPGRAAIATSEPTHPSAWSTSPEALAAVLDLLDAGHPDGADWFTGHGVGPNLRHRWSDRLLGRS